MRVLIVEDDLDYLEDLESAARDIVGECNVFVARSKGSAQVVLGEQEFDFFILDQKIPTEDDALDEELQHGQAVYADVRDRFPYAPVYFLTAFQGEDFIADLQADAERLDVWGDGTPFPLVRTFRKGRLPDLLEEVKRAHQSYVETEGVEYDGRLVGIDLNHGQRRVLKTLARRHSGASVSVFPMPGGFSESRVIGVRVKDGNGSVRVVAVGRIWNVEAIVDERVRYNQGVIRLPHATYCSYVDEVLGGARGNGGIFYQHLEGFDRSLFDLLPDDEGAACSIIDGLQDMEGRWTDGVPTANVTIAEIRRRVVSDEVMDRIAGKLSDFDWEGFEKRDVQSRWCCQHGDLHGSNVLVDRDDKSTIIDFAEVGDASACLDAITLELSLLWHPEGRRIVGEWPSPERARSWCSVEEYVADCPVPNFVRRARDWTMAVTGGPREVLATAYAHSVRQLKYEDTNDEQILGIVESVFEGMELT